MPEMSGSVSALPEVLQRKRDNVNAKLSHRDVDLVVRQARDELSGAACPHMS